ncbi:DUF4175 family protein [Tenacibaculum sp. UWU-22]|uniref:DUF4175 family protein n=1 Tax=Tenacibaculum sp. UWU-22 TaxID=3234187 RepID=UPI0034DADC35
MEQYQKINEKLHQFTRKYYTNELIKGSILFLSLGLLYLFFTLFIEYFLWLKPTARTILFWLFILTELGLLIRFICFPIFKLMGLQKGISLEESSKIIGNHFPEVKDKLLNVLQLKKNASQSDLLLASIAQKSRELQPIPFTKAVDFSKNKKYIPYILVPIFIWLLTFFTGKNTALTKSLDRVVHYRTAYTPPAPFSFFLKDENLTVIQGKPLTVFIETKGNVIPEEAKIYFNNQHYYLKNNGGGLFSYTFAEVNNPINFYVEANGIQSKNYLVNVIKTPTIQEVKMRLLYPKYINKPNDLILSTGNTTIPQGTNIEWIVKTKQTDSVAFINKEKRSFFNKKEENIFNYRKKILQNTNYTIASSNKKIKDFEQLQYSINVIPDEYPSITVKSNIDSISRGPAQFAGQIADDYGIEKLELVYYNENSPQLQQTYNLPIHKKNIQSFFYQFPDGLNLQEGINYQLFFQVYDNDRVNGSKKTTSKKFSYRQKTTQEIDEELLKEQKNVINDLQNSLEQQQQNKEKLEKIQFDLQNKKNANWTDQKKIESFIKRQEQYKNMMERQTEKLKENFDKKDDPTEKLTQKKDELKNRIDELKKIEKQEKLLDELRKMAEKLDKENLIKKAKELSQQNKQQERSLERILELTKRFYVEQKMNQLANKLDELAKKQDELAKKNTSSEEQEKLNKEFEKTKEDFEKLKQDNEKLKEPMNIPEMEDLQKETEDELNKAQENLDQQNQSQAKENQKNASKKMKQMKGKMQMAMQMMSAQEQEENIDDLRQILENLVTFSFDQENLMTVFSHLSASHPNYGKSLQQQHILKTYFEHIDDSLFVLSMRLPKITSKIQDQLAIAHYNLDQSLDNFSENLFPSGISNQRYVMTAANTLANMLSNTLDQMQNMTMSNSGSGKKGEKKEFSLPDIIEKQGDLLKQMEQDLKKGNDGKPKEGEDGKKEGKKGDNSEQSNEKTYEIYKKQAQLRQQLEDIIKQNEGGTKEAIKAIKEMEELENQILEKGLTKQIVEKMKRLNYQLLKLDKAAFEQGEEQKRKSNTNTKKYQKNTAKELIFKKLFYNETEILNRQSLPLRQNYKKKVQEYFSVPEEHKKQ